VAYIEKDGIVTANFLHSRDLTTEGGAPWGLGRISHKEKGSTDYIYDTTAGEGVTVYVIDTGVYIEHSEFGDRATWGANFVSGSPVSFKFLSPYSSSPPHLLTIIGH
jgi:oryzin